MYRSKHFFPGWLGLVAMIALVAAASFWDAFRPTQVLYSVAFASSPPIPIIVAGTLWLSSTVGTYVCFCRGYFLVSGCPIAWVTNGMLALLGGCWITLTILCACNGVWDACLLLAAGDVGWATILLSHQAVLRGA